MNEKFKFAHSLFCSTMALHIVLLLLCINVSMAQNESWVSIMDFGAIGDGKTCDTAAFMKAWEAICGGTMNASTLTIPQGKTFLLQAVRFLGPCMSLSITIQMIGNIKAPMKENWESDSFPGWINFSNVSNLILKGSGQIDAQGSSWWNCTQGKPCYNRHATLVFDECNNVQVSGIKSINSQNNHISIVGCNNSTISSVHLIAPVDSPNTDGIDISQSSTNIRIHDVSIQTGDDCVAITNGCSFINISGINCGPGHGISIGSLGKDGGEGTVEEVHVKNSILTATQNGARIKTWPGGKGFVRKITFENITLVSVDNPIVIDQFYCPDTTCEDQPSAINISDVSFNGIHGTSMAKYVIRFNCSRNVPCTNIVVDHINITSSEPDLNLKTFCNNAYGRSNDSYPSLNCLLPDSVVENETDDLAVNSDVMLVQNNIGRDEL